jgi:hypothetical protein
MHKTDYIYFEEEHSSGKTKAWAIRTKSNGMALGYIRWHGPWRKYCCFPWEGTVFDPNCLFTIGLFCEDQTKAHLAGLKEARTETINQ